MLNWTDAPPRPWPLLALAALIACAPAAPAEFTEADAQAVRDTVTTLENAMNLAVDGLDCDGGLAHMRGREPVFIGNARVVRTDAAVREMCSAMVAPRTGATFVMDTLTAHALSADAAYVVREGSYTIDFKEGPSQTMRLVMTTIWERHAEGWRMSHLHESFVPVG